MEISLKFIHLLLVVSPILAKSLDFFFDKLDIVPTPNEVAKVDVKVNKTSSNQFLVSGVVEQLVEIDDKWKVELGIEFSESPSGYFNVTKLLKIEVCFMMKTVYKQLLYEKLKKVCVNAPSPDVCPLPIREYVIEEYPLDLAKYESLFVPGYYKFDLALYSDEEDFKVKFVVYTHATEV